MTILFYVLVLFILGVTAFINQKSFGKLPSGARLELIKQSPNFKDGTITVTKGTLEQCISKKNLLYDKNGEEHYNIISALHKSIIYLLIFGILSNFISSNFISDTVMHINSNFI